MTAPTAALQLSHDAFAGEPGVDTAVSAVLLERVDAGAQPEILRLYRPGRVVAFGRQDVAADGYRDAVEAARAGGYDAIERLAGGRAAVFTPSTIAFGWEMPAADPRATTQERFELVAGWFRDALRDLGVDARIGEVPGEYCPGRFSVNAADARKLMGVGQRLKRKAAHVGGVLVVDDAAGINEILEPVYAAMSFEWDASVTGAVSDVAPGVTFDDVIEALVARLERPVSTGEIDAEVIAEARQRAPTYVAA